MGLPIVSPAFSHPNSMRIFGPAGAGKTRVVVEYLQEHVAKGEISLLRSIIVSFTRAASADIASRVNPGGQPGIYHTTLHGLCRRFYAYEGQLAEPMLGKFFAEHGIAYKAHHSADPEDWTAGMDNSPGGQVVAFWGWMRNRMLPLEEARAEYRGPRDAIGPLLESEKGMVSLWADYVKWKRDNSVIDYTDMLEWVLSDPPQGEDRWDCFVLDEAQDCTPLQWHVANAFARCAGIAYIAGDDDQAIYGWAGANPREFLEAEVTVDEMLHINYRSAANIIDVSQEFIRRNRFRRDKDIYHTRLGGSIEYTHYLPQLSTDESTFVMARAHYLNSELMVALQHEGYPFVDQRNFYGVSGAASSAFARYLRLSRGAAITLQDWHRLLEAIPAKPWMMPGEKTRIARLSRDEREGTFVSRTNLLDWGATDMLVAAVSTGSLDPLKMLSKERLDYLTTVEERHGVSFLDPAVAGAACTVGTIHRFKGLEADHVVLHAGMSPGAAYEARQNPEPERRVFYVAMTRAKERLTHYTALDDKVMPWERLL